MPRALLLLALSFTGACSADAVPEPEPTLDSKGVFVAVAADEGDYQLLRILAALGNGDDNDALFVVPYVPMPKSYEEARELAKDSALPAKAVTAIGRRYITSREWRVVWFRSVSSEEEAEYR